MIIGNDNAGDRTPVSLRMGLVAEFVIRNALRVTCAKPFGFQFLHAGAIFGVSRMVFVRSGKFHISASLSMMRTSSRPNSRGVIRPAE